jgi:hypothetical protein
MSEEKNKFVAPYDKCLVLAGKCMEKYIVGIAVQLNVTCPIIIKIKSQTAWNVNVFSDKLLILASKQGKHSAYSLGINAVHKYQNMLLGFCSLRFHRECAHLYTGTTNVNESINI